MPSIGFETEIFYISHQGAVPHIQRS